MINPQDLVSKMKTQHSALQKDLALAMDLASQELPNLGEKILLSLTQFKRDLLEHLDLENGEFYPDYLSRQDKRGVDLRSTKEFIKEMDDIGVVVMGFLDKYSKSEAIKNNLNTFKTELNEIIGVLNTRIETEEEGLFDLYLIIS